MISTESAILMLAGALLLFSPEVILRKEWSENNLVKILSDNNKLVAIVCISAGLYLSAEKPKIPVAVPIQLTSTPTTSYGTTSSAPSTSN